MWGLYGAALRPCACDDHAMDCLGMSCMVGCAYWIQPMLECLQLACHGTVPDAVLGLLRCHHVPAHAIRAPDDPHRQIVKRLIGAEGDLVLVGGSSEMEKVPQVRQSKGFVGLWGDLGCTRRTDLCVTDGFYSCFRLAASLVGRWLNVD